MGCGASNNKGKANPNAIAYEMKDNKLEKLMEVF